MVIVFLDIYFPSRFIKKYKNLLSVLKVCDLPISDLNTWKNESLIVSWSKSWIRFFFTGIFTVPVNKFF